MFSDFEIVLLSEDAYSVRWLVCFSVFFCFMYLEVTCVVWFR